MQWYKIYTQLIQNIIIINIHITNTIVNQLMQIHSIKAL